MLCYVLAQLFETKKQKQFQYQIKKRYMLTCFYFPFYKLLKPPSMSNNSS